MISAGLTATDFRLSATQGGSASKALDPETKNTYTRETTLWLERELMPNFSLRAGFVYRAIRQNRQRVNANQPFDGFTVPVTISDRGPTASAGTPTTASRFRDTTSTRRC